ncbi:MAG: helix-turn-helix transcriptional regulator [Syntrophaceae bacterium]|nr:helix-turn-helix transcriptional regulator [Syntrophaceae bacterium]
MSREIYTSDCMVWNKEIFVRNIDELIKNFCNGNATVFNKKIGSRDAATRWKYKNIKPSLENIITICDVFGCSADWLLTGSDTLQFKICPVCGDWSNEVKEACRKLHEIMESGDDRARETIMNNLDLIGRGMTKRAGRKGKKDLPEMQTEPALPARKGKQTAAR